jgi:hypothetical protein
VRARSKTPRIKSCYPILANIIITYFNYNKPSYFVFIYPESRKRNLKEIKEKELYELEKENKSGEKKP